jgi:hypothetical protein
MMFVYHRHMENLIPMKTTQSKWAGISKVFKVGAK